MRVRRLRTCAVTAFATGLVSVSVLAVSAASGSSVARPSRAARPGLRERPAGSRLRSGAGGGHVGGPAAQAPTVAVAPGGTAYLAWNGAAGVWLCAIPRTTARCHPRLAVKDGLNDFLEPPLVRAGRDGVVDLITENAAGDAVLLVSRDAGERFTPAARLGAGQYFNGAFGPGGEVLLTNDENGLESLVDQPGGPPARFVEHDRAVTPGSSAAGWSGRTPVIVGAVPEGAFAWHWTGRGTPTERRRWIRRRLAADELSTMAAGRRGLFLLEEEAILDRRAALTVWRWRSGRFHRVGRLPSAASSSEVAGVALAQGARGALVAAWYDRPATAIFAEVSRDGGRRWSAPHELAAQVDPVFRMSLALGRDGHGVVAYDSMTGGVWVAPVSVHALGRDG